MNASNQHASCRYATFDFAARVVSMASDQSNKLEVLLDALCRLSITEKEAAKLFDRVLNEIVRRSLGTGTKL